MEPDRLIDRAHARRALEGLGGCPKVEGQRGAEKAEKACVEL